MEFIHLFSTLFQKLALFITLATLQGTIDYTARKHHVLWRLRSIAHGIVFGLFATVDMLNPIALSEGIHLDTRNIIIMVITASNNGVTGFVTMLIVCAVRIAMGGAGVVPALGAAASAYVLGRLYLRYGSRSTLSQSLVMIGFGIALAFFNLIWLVFLPSHIALHILSLVAPPICIFYPLGTTIMHTALSYSRRYVKIKHMLDHEHTMLRTLIDNVPDYIHIQGVDGKFLMTNQAYADAAGLKSEAFLGKTMRDVFPNHINTHDAEDYHTVMRGDAIIGQMREVQMPGVAPLWMSITKVPMRDAEGSVTGIITVNRDMSEARRAEVALAESGTRYRSVVQNMVEGIVLQNINGAVETYNSQAETILGLTRDQMMQLSPVDDGWRAVY